MEDAEAAKMLKSLGDPTRLRIFEMLKEGPKCACTLLKEFNITQPTLSYHMKSLLASKIVTCERTGKWCNYSIDGKRLSGLLAYLFEPIRKTETERCLGNERK